MKDLYSWFLGITGRPSSEAQDWIAQTANRETALDKGSHFAAQMYELLREVATDSGTMRYLVV